MLRRDHWTWRLPSAQLIQDLSQPAHLLAIARPIEIALSLDRGLVVLARLLEQSRHSRVASHGSAGSGAVCDDFGLWCGPCLRATEQFGQGSVRGFTQDHPV